MNQFQQLYQAPPFCQYEYQGQGQAYPPSQNQIPPQALLRNLAADEYSRKRGLEHLTSPYKGINQQGEKKQKGGSPEVYYDMDAGVVRTEQRIDPVNDMILARLDRLSIELKSTVKSSELSILATKEDLEKLSDRLNRQDTRITELEASSRQYQTDINLLQSRVNELGQRPADRGVDTNVYQQSRHIGSGVVAGGGGQNKRFNLVIEGIPMDVDLYEYVITLAYDMDIMVYMRDLTLVNRLRRRSAHDKRPGPVLVCFVHAYIRDKFLRGKRGLKGTEKYGDVWIKADETMDVRRLKSEFRKIAYQARQKGEDVYFNHEMIRIGETEYYARDLEKIPKEYRVEGRGMENKQNLGATGQETPKDQRPETIRERRPLVAVRRPSEIISERQRKSTAHDMDIDGENTVPLAIGITTDQLDEARNASAKVKATRQLQPIVKIRKTPYGIIFSGETAYISNHYECDVEDDDIVHRSNEHGYFYNKAKVYKRPDIAKAITEETDKRKLKGYFVGLGDNPEWERMRGPTLRRLFAKKMQQHPVLEEQLIGTAPHRLIEGSVDNKWGGGEPFSSKKYDDGTFGGNNEFGDIATEYRDKKLAQLRRNKVTQK